MNKFLSFLIALFLLALPVMADEPSIIMQNRADVEKIIKEYILKHPEIIQEAANELERRQHEEEIKATEKLVLDKSSLLYKSENHTIIGNVNGDVTLVEFFDYNCGYCRHGISETKKLLENDKNISLILKEFPILSQGSKEASIIALALREQFSPDKLWQFHVNLMQAKGNVGKAEALKVAQSLGADMKKLEASAASPKIEEALNETQILAENLSINGTPTFIVGGKLLVGAKKYEDFEKVIKSVRENK